VDIQYLQLSPRILEEIKQGPLQWKLHERELYQIAQEKNTENQIDAVFDSIEFLSIVPNLEAYRTVSFVLRAWAKREKFKFIQRMV
jgi:hypothetical protein